MMLVVVIVGIMSSLAVPSLIGVTRAQQERTVIEQVAAILAEARARAGAENRCYRVRATNASTLVVERRNTIDCVHLDKDGWNAPIRTFTVPSAFALRHETIVPDSACGAVTAPGGACDIIFRPSGRLRGSGVLSTAAEGSRISLQRIVGGSASVVATIDIEPVGRFCSKLRPGSVSTLTGPVVCP